MKPYLKILALIISVQLFNCKESNDKSNSIETRTETKYQDSIVTTSSVVPKTKTTPKTYNYFYVAAKSGLNYRDKPNGKVLGKFPLNSYVNVIENTGITHQVKDGGKTIKGEWVGVEKDKDTVYVFSGFLSPNYTPSDIQLYLASSFYAENNGDTRTAFINISETYFTDLHTHFEGQEREHYVLTEQDFSKDTIRLNKNQRKKFLKQSLLSETDKVFIYSINDGNVETFKVKDLPAIACINIYFGSGGYEKSEYDYEFGFDLGQRNIGDFVFIGKKDPFKTGKLTSIIWKKATNTNFPKQINDNIKMWWLDNGYTKGDAYKFSNSDYEYVVQNINRKGELNTRYLFIIDITDNKVIFNKIFSESEGTYLIPLNTKTKEGYSEYQFAGQLFKDKSDIIFGFESHSFGCPSITIIDPTEPPVPTLCDNRH